MIEKISRFLSGRGRLVKAMSKSTAKAALFLLTRLRGFYVNPELVVGSYQMLLGRWEPGTVEICKKTLRRGMTVVDVGAHVGYFSRIFSRLVGDSGKVFSFEPHPVNFGLLKKNTGRLKNMALVNAAVSSNDGPVTFYESPVGSGSHSLFLSRYGYARKIQVEGLTLDKYFYNKRVNFIKIDVEGAELEVLNGARNLLASADAPMLIVEFSPGILRSRGISPVDLLVKLEEFGYKIFAVDEKKAVVIPIKPSNSKEDFVNSIKKYANLFCTKRATDPVF